MPSWLVAIAAPLTVIGHTPALAQTHEPQVNEARLFQAKDHAQAMYDQCWNQRPQRPEDEEGFG
jgi:hypothetical protein